jgi:hypothetical protein
MVGCGSEEPGTGAPEQTFSLDLTEPVGVFASDADRDVHLSSIGGGALLSTGGVVVLDRQSRQVVEYSADGAIVRVLGGEGNGPGEFSSPRGLSVLPGDTVVVYDPRNRRLSLYAPGEVDPELQPLDQGVFSRPPTRLWRLPDGWSLSEETSIRDVEIIRSGSEADVMGTKLLVKRVGPRGDRIDTLVSGAVGSETVRVGAMQLMAAFGHRTLVAVAGGLVAIAPAYEASVRVYRGTAVEWEAELAGGSELLGDREVAQLRDSLRQLAADQGAPFTAEVLFSPELQPERRPAFEELRLDSEGRVLLREFEPLLRESRRWWVVEPGQGFVGRIVLPEGTDILQVEGDQLLVARRDSLDVPRVELHELDWGRLAEGGTS